MKLLKKIEVYKEIEVVVIVEEKSLFIFCHHNARKRELLLRRRHIARMRERKRLKKGEKKT